MIGTAGGGGRSLEARGGRRGQESPGWGPGDGAHCPLLPCGDVLRQEGTHGSGEILLEKTVRRTAGGGTLKLKYVLRTEQRASPVWEGPDVESKAPNQGPTWQRPCEVTEIF